MQFLLYFWQLPQDPPEAQVLDKILVTVNFLIAEIELVT